MLLGWACPLIPTVATVSVVGLSFLIMRAFCRVIKYFTLVIQIRAYLNCFSVEMFVEIVVRREVLDHIAMATAILRVV